MTKINEQSSGDFIEQVVEEIDNTGLGRTVSESTFTRRVKTATAIVGTAC